MIRTNLKHALTLSALAFLVHGAWEFAACLLFYEHLGYPATISGMLRATSGDIALTWLAYAAVAATSWRWRWASQSWRYRELAVLLGTAVVLAVAVELRALRLEAWSYRPSMPTIGGVGVVPILQLTLLTPLIVSLSERIIAGRAVVRGARSRLL